LAAHSRHKGTKTRSTTEEEGTETSSFVTLCLCDIWSDFAELRESRSKNVTTSQRKKEIVSASFDS
jgi:hypothetical protein